MKDCTKTQLKNALKELLCWAVLCGICFGASTLMFAFYQETGSDGSGFLPITVCRPNLLCYAAGALIYLVCAGLAWFMLIRPALDVSMQGHAGWVLLWVLISLLGIVGLLMAAVTGVILQFGLFSRSDPEILDLWMLAAPLIMLLAVAAELVRRLIRRRKLTA